MKQEERIERFQQFKDFKKRILVTTDLFGRGIDIERVNIVINYDYPDDTDQYLHRVARAGIFFIEVIQYETYSFCNDF